MHNETHRLPAEQQVYAPVNRLYRYPDIVGPDTAGNLRAPNNDTLYYSGWFDISAEPLSRFTPGQRPEKPPEKTADAIDPLSSLAFFEVLNESLKSLPARSSEAALMSQFDLIGVGRHSEFKIEGLSPGARRGLERALADGEAIVQAATQRTIPNYNGWMISKQIGRYGFSYMHRAAVARGGYGNLPEESLYPAMVFDADGELLDGGRRYQLHFAAGELPPVNGFWSLAAYRLNDLQLEDNAIQRYSIGDRTRALSYNADGSLTLTLQHAGRRTIEPIGCRFPRVRLCSSCDCMNPPPPHWEMITYCPNWKSSVTKGKSEQL